MEDKRRHIRVAIETPVVVESSEREPLPGIGADMSVGGMFIKAESTPPFGSEVTIVLDLPDRSGVLRLPGVVRWRKPGGFGVQFGLLGARETHIIANLIKH